MKANFKCKDEVLVREKVRGNPRFWTYGIISHIIDSSVTLAGGIGFHSDDFEIIPYKGNEHLVGTTNDPDSDTKPDMGEVSDGYHTFNELYRFRMLYNAAFVNQLPSGWAVKSTRHSGGEQCFGGGWFIVQVCLPTGQISNHYEMKYWDLFNIPEVKEAAPWDGHTPQDVMDRLEKFLKSPNKVPLSFSSIGEKTPLLSVTSLGDGIYKGTMSGYTFQYKGKYYKCSEGVRGINCSVTIEVKHGKDTILS